MTTNRPAAPSTTAVTNLLLSAPSAAIKQSASKDKTPNKKIVIIGQHEFAVIYEKDIAENPVIETSDLYDCCALLLYDKKIKRTLLTHINMRTDIEQSMPVLLGQFDCEPSALDVHLVPGMAHNTATKLGYDSRADNVDATVKALAQHGVKQYVYHNNSYFGGFSDVSFTPKDGKICVDTHPYEDRALRLKKSGTSVELSLLPSQMDLFKVEKRSGIIRNGFSTTPLLPTSKVRDGSGKMILQEKIPCATQNEVMAYNKTVDELYTSYQRKAEPEQNNCFPCRIL